MIIDAENRVVQLCAAGMAIEGDAPAAVALFEEAWQSRSNDYESCIAAHFLARHQANPEETLRWNLLAVKHAEAVAGGRANELLASLYLNLGDAYRAAEQNAEAAAAAKLAHAALIHLPTGGYRDFVERAIERLQQRLAEAD